MAKTLTLYPVADISLEHITSNESATVGYTSISEVTSDDTVSYLTQSVSGSSQEVTSTSIFKCDNTDVIGKIYITGISSFVRASAYHYVLSSQLTTVITPSVSINNGEFVDGSAHTLNSTTSTTNWSNLTDDYTTVDGLNTIYQSPGDANVELRLSQVSTVGSDGLKTSVTPAITQANVTITYLDVYNCTASFVPGSGVGEVQCTHTEVIDGQTCTFTATLQDGVRFVGWYSDEYGENLVSVEQTYTPTINSDTILYAKGDIEYTISVYADDNCTVATTATSALLGDSVTIEITPNSDRYKIDGWYSNPERTSLVTTENPHTFIVKGNSVFYAKTHLHQMMYVKRNNEWVACSKVYMKVDGNWVEQTEYNGLFVEDKNYKIIEV